MEARRAPVNAITIGAHLIGAVGMLAANRDRIRHQSGVGASSAIETVRTGAGLAATAYSGALGVQVGRRAAMCASRAWIG